MSIMFEKPHNNFKKMILFLQWALIFLVILLFTKDWLMKKMLKNFQPPSILVTSTDVESLPLNASYTRPAVCESKIFANIHTQIEGEIALIDVHPGQYVSQGQILLILKSDLITPQLNAAIAQWEFAADVYQRQQALYQAQAISLQDYQESQTNFIGALTRKDNLEAQYARCILIAPCDGYLSDFSWHIGDFLASGQKVFECYNKNTIDIVSYVSSEILHQLKEGDSILFKTKKKEYKGSIRTVQKNLHPQLQQGIIRAELESLADEIEPGLRGTVVLTTASVQNQLAISPIALGATPLGPCVWLLQQSDQDPKNYKAKEISVQILGFQGDKVFVESPELQAGSKIALYGQFKLNPNVQLQIRHV